MANEPPPPPSTLIHCACMIGPNDPDPKCPECGGTGDPNFDIKAHIADEAKRIVSGARRSAYGTPEANFARIARLWDAYMKNSGRDVTITAADVSPMMALMKIARLGETPAHYDSIVDLVGYALTMAEVNGVKAP